VGRCQPAGGLRLHLLADECQQHHRRLGGDQRVGCAGWHVQPGPGIQIELLGVDGEAKTSRQDLDHGGSGCLVFGELFAGVEGEHGDVQPTAPVNHPGDHRACLDGHLACRIGNQCVGHISIMLQALPVTSIQRCMICSLPMFGDARSVTGGPLRCHSHVRMAIVNRTLTPRATGHHGQRCSTLEQISKLAEGRNEFAAGKELEADPF
jgi:hypothetical protein